MQDGEDITGVIPGLSVNNDGHTMGLTVPNLEGQQDVINQALAGVVATPGLLPKKPAKRVKTDRLDAIALAKNLRNGDITSIYVPPDEDEAVRDYPRMHEDFKIDLKKAKQRLFAFLPRYGLNH